MRKVITSKRKIRKQKNKTEKRKTNKRGGGIHATQLLDKRKQAHEHAKKHRENEKTIIDLKRKINENVFEIDELQKELSSKIRQLVRYKNNLENHKKNHGDIDIKDSFVKNNEKLISGLEKRIKSIQDRITELESIYQENTKDIDFFETENKTHDVRIGALEF
jgi:chromosome segregation ATPase